MINIKCCDNLELMKELEDNSVDLIYSDILFGTSRKFKDYQDLKPKREIIEEHYIPRIKEMYRILKDTGSIYLQMDWRINHWVRCIMDDIFGYDNFRNEIIWKYGLGRSSDKQFSKRHDIILWYSKSSNYQYNKQYEKATSQRLKGCVKNMSDVWVDIPSINNMAIERIGYATQKPKPLLERIIKASSNKGDVVADFYAGSHTTGEVALELNRSYIGCDINPRSLEIANERLKRFK